MDNNKSNPVVDDNRIFLYVPTDAELNEIEAQFNYQRPAENQIPRYQDVRELGRAFALSILRNCPPCPDRSAALRKVREAVMTANAAIALEETIRSGRPLVAHQGADAREGAAAMAGEKTRG